MRKKYFLGLDLSLSCSGYCVIDQTGKIRKIGNVISQPTTPDVESRFVRYSNITASFEQILKTFWSQIEVVAIENYSYGSKGKIIQLVECGTMVRNLVRDRIFERRKFIYEVAPISLKKFILGSGKIKSAKNIMCREVWKKYKYEIDDDNMVDAFLLSKVAQGIFLVREGHGDKIKKKYQREVITNILKPKKKSKRRKKNATT